MLVRTAERKILGGFRKVQFVAKILPPLDDVSVVKTCMMHDAYSVCAKSAFVSQSRVTKPSKNSRVAALGLSHPRIMHLYTHVFHHPDVAEFWPQAIA
jgi:hypothetical protein